jgi:hypothetical protein
MKIWQSIVMCLGVAMTTQTWAADFQQEERWWKGNTHTHTWWSDGDTPPELVAQWYKEHGYNFLVFTDHNVIQVGTKWYPIDAPRLCGGLWQGVG